jgi:signal peptidase I
MLEVILVNSIDAAVTPQVEQLPAQQEKAGWLSALWADTLKAAGITLLIFLFVVTFVVQGFKVYGSCMEPNLATGQRLLGNKFIYRFEKPARGDVIVFRYPYDPSKIYIKRVVGLPGETIEIRHGEVLINGQRLDEPYIHRIPHGDYSKTLVEPGKLFVMGDFRDVSNDSRYWGELPMQNIQAKVWLRYWPMNEMELVK